MAIFPNPEELYPDWRDWARVLGRYLIDEEMERRRDVSQRLGRFFIQERRTIVGITHEDLIYSARAPFRVIGISNAWHKVIGTTTLTISKIIPPITSSQLNWTHGTPTSIPAIESATPTVIYAHSEGLCTANCDIAAGEILTCFQFAPSPQGEYSFTIEAEDLSWNL